MRLDEGTAFVGFVAKICPRGSDDLSVPQTPLEQCKSSAAAVLEIPLGRSAVPIFACHEISLLSSQRKHRTAPYPLAALIPRVERLRYYIIIHAIVIAL